MVWQSLLRNWVREQARQKAFDAVRQAAEARATAQPAQGGVPCDVGLVFALGAELGGLEDLLQGVLTTRGSEMVVRQGHLKGRSVVLVQAGAGCLAAARGTQALIAGHRPKWVISAGFAGGLDPKLGRGDILMVDSVTDASGRKLAIDLKVSPESLAGTPRLHVGRLLTVDSIVRRAEEKRALGQAHAALALDMETWAVAEVCRQDKVRFLAVRIISDTVDDELPAEVEPLVRQKTRAARLGAAAGAIFHRPSSVKDMLKLKENALVASDRLARFLAGMIVQLVPPEEESH